MENGERVRVSSARGSVVAPVRIDPSLRPGLAFMTLHFPDEVETNLLTINATDPKSGTAEFKATAIRVDRIPGARARGRGRGERGGAHGFLMDIVIQNELPTSAEREAVDAVLGPPASSWEGAPEASRRDQRVARGGHAARARRHLLLPTLHAVQARVGWISRGALNYVCRRLTIPPAEAYGVASFYALFSLEPEPPVVVHVCTDVACIAHGSQDLVAELERRVGREGEHPGNGQAVWHESPCLGMCEFAPAAMLHGGRRGAARGVGRAGERRRRRRPARRRRRAGRAAAARAAGRRSVAPAPAPRGRRRSRQHRQLPRARRLRRAARGHRDGARPGAARGERLQADGPRRRRVPDRPQVGGGGPQRQAPPLPDLQRRRVRAGDVQGPRDPRARPVLRSSRR